MGNMFAKAKDKATKTVAKGGKKNAKPEFAIDELDTIAAIDAVMKSLEAMKKTVEADVKDQMKDIFATEGLKKHVRPKNFKGFDNNSFASCELKKRSTRSTLSEDEVNLLDKHGIPYDVVSDVTTTFIINPAYAQDEDLLATVGELLDGHVPDDFIEMQTGVDRRVVSDRSLDQAFDAKTKKDLLNLLNVVGTFSLKPKYDGDVKDAIDFVKELLD